ncbi:MAG TPA: sulfurtransferase [Nitrospirae bacterium]|nr:thiosulfate sulfurtransferase [bacterium BMS3Abin06]HDH10725.1 sulfurtransferase [Nitrospirota bacterium]HDZ03013.1 sulfurtransferase [Nitrospirota bacterium]
MLLLHKKVKNLRKTIITLVSALFLLICLSAGYQNAYAGADVPSLVETEWLAENLQKEELRIIYIAAMSPGDKQNFDAKHIPGALYLDIGSFMNVLGNGSAPPDKAKFEALMGRLGISNDTNVVVLSKGGGNPFIASALWLMEYFGHEKICYLNGGMAKWNKEGRQTTGAPAKINPAVFKASPNPSILATADYVLKNLRNPKVVIVDARGKGEYDGTQNVGQNKRTGHIPGAINLNFYPTNLNNDGTFKSVKELKAVYEAKGVTKDKEIISYCQGGVRAANTYFVLKHLLGYPEVRNYVGSWGEWGNRLDPARYPLEK